MPLNRVLGTEANVRVLRVLAEREATISAAEVARRAQLQRSTVSRTLRNLEELGVIEYKGVAPQAQASLRDRGPVARALRQLFAAERERFEALLDGLKRAADRTTPPPMSAWIGGAVGLGIDRPGNPVPVYVLDKPDRVAIVAQLFRNEIERLEQKLDLQTEVHEVTLADLATLPFSEGRLRSAIPVAGVPPQGLASRVKKGGAAKPRARKGVRSHGERDAAALQRATEIADALRDDPSLLHEARAYVEKRWREASAGERKELGEWRRILRSNSSAAVRKALTDPGERGTRLRQTLPFFRSSGHR